MYLKKSMLSPEVSLMDDMFPSISVACVFDTDPQGWRCGETQNPCEECRSCGGFGSGSSFELEVLVKRPKKPKNWQELRGQKAVFLEHDGHMRPYGCNTCRFFCVLSSNAGYLSKTRCICYRVWLIRPWFSANEEGQESATGVLEVGRGCWSFWYVCRYTDILYSFVRTIYKYNKIYIWRPDTHWLLKNVKRRNVRQYYSTW